MAGIQLRGLVKRYGKGAGAVPVLHGIDATVNDGEFVVIVGPSGCGKSTLLRMVAGLEDITEAVRVRGHITLDERMAIRLASTFCIHTALEVADLDLRSLHPKEFVRKHLLDELTGDPVAIGLEVDARQRARADRRACTGADRRARARHGARGPHAARARAGAGRGGHAPAGASPTGHSTRGTRRATG